MEYLSTLQCMLCVLTLLGGVETRWMLSRNAVEYQLFKEDFSWDHFVYTQQWPPALCIDTYEHKCVIPKNVTTWTVHGLWPSQGDTMGPCYCNKTWHFDPNQLQNLLGNLWKYWPNLYTTSLSDKYDFWKHEWEKHGTCATNITKLNSEYRYFKKGLELQTVVDIASVLEAVGISPSNTTSYQVDVVKQALAKRFGNGSIVMECTYTKEPQQQYLKQVEVCLNKSSFEPIPCPSNLTSHYGHYGQRNPCAANEDIKHTTVRFGDRYDGERDKCKGNPEQCECIDTLMIPKYYHPNDKAKL